MRDMSRVGHKPELESSLGKVGFQTFLGGDRGSLGGDRDTHTWKEKERDTPRKRERLGRH